MRSVLRRFVLDPNQISSVLAGFSCKRLDATVDLLDATLQCFNDLRDLSETDALQELRVIGIQVVTKLTATDDICDLPGLLCKQ